MNTICMCNDCTSGKYNPKDYMLSEEDFVKLDKERPFGLSGFMRVKNEALTLAESIESSIDFLDELIILYNDSEDNSEQILQTYKEKYPNKIRLYYYAPPLAAFAFREVSTSPKTFPEYYYDSNSIHNTANYHNFGYTKISYKYYIKIDPDQIYFTKKLLKIKKGLFFAEKIRNNKWIANNILKKITNNINTILSSLQTTNSSIFFNDFFLSFFASLKLNNQLVLNFGGINLLLPKNQKEENFRMTTKIDLLIKNNNKNMSDMPFNGCVGDHMIWIPISSIRFSYDPKEKYETIKPSETIVNVGFAWVHFCAIKIMNPYGNKYVMESISLEKLQKLSWQKLCSSQFEIMFQENYYKEACFAMAKLFWDYDRRYLKDKSLVKTLKDLYKKSLIFVEKKQK